MAPRTVLPVEICVGLVLHLDPVSMKNAGATFSCSDQMAVFRSGYFVCISHDGARRIGKWLPLYGDNSIGRVEVDSNLKSGIETWRQNPTYFHPDQVWEVRDALIPSAARDGHDLTEQGRRNRLKNAASLLAPPPAPPTPPTGGHSEG
jgi:hypothetical protein